MTFPLLRLLPAAALACGACAGGGASRERASLDSPVPDERLHAIELAQRTEERTDLEGLVESLDSDDAAVRLMAIVALEELTGERLGYDYRDSPVERRPAIERWVEYVTSGALSAPFVESVPAVPAPAPGGALPRGTERDG